MTRWVLAHKMVVLLAWVVLTLAGAATAGTTTNRLDKTFTLPGQPSFVVDSHIAALYHGETGQDPFIPVISSPAGTSLRGPSGSAVLARATAAASLGGRYRVLGLANTADARFATADGTSTFLLVFTPPVGFGSADPTPAITAAVRSALPAGWSEVTTGSGPLQSAGGSQKGLGVFSEALLGGVGALVVLAVVFASFLAVLPLIMALVAIPTTFLALLGLTTFTKINFVVQFLVGLVGLGVSIDYALLVTTRWREEMAHSSSDEAVVTAMATAGRSVVFSGITVAIGLAGLIIIPVPFLHSMGYGGVLIPLVSVAAALTLLPVCLARIGPALDRHRLRRADSASPPWMAWARLVNRRRIPAVVLGLAIVGVIIFPVLHLRVGQALSSSLATSGPAHDGLATLTRGGVPSGVLGPAVVLVDQPSAAPGLVNKLARIPGVWTAVGPSGPAGQRGGTALVTVLPSPEIGASGGKAVVNQVRQAVAGDPAVVGVGGSGVETVDFDNAIYGNFPLLLALVSVLTFLVLVRAFRSLLLAVKAIVLNLASLAAAYGVLVFVWQDGHGSNLVFGLPATGAVVDWVPIVVFAFLFGLAIDYEVFILTRMREVWDATGSTSQSVVEGIGRTGRLVTSAALILTLAFLSMSTAPFTFLKILATGLAAGILIDAFVVRSLLVPALVSLFGRWNWALPRWLGRTLLIRNAGA